MWGFCVVATSSACLGLVFVPEVVFYWEHSWSDFFSILSLNHSFILLFTLCFTIVFSPFISPSAMPSSCFAFLFLLPTCLKSHPCIVCGKTIHIPFVLASLWLWSKPCGHELKFEVNWTMRILYLVTFFLICYDVCVACNSKGLNNDNALSPISFILRCPCAFYLHRVIITIFNHGHDVHLEQANVLFGTIGFRNINKNQFLISNHCIISIILR